uniref:Putative secreted peptide n=1 Tax=Anopheles braziliensis TaxID=58242 RepID=A0A2M3ZWN3_9DIPT
MAAGWQVCSNMFVVSLLVHGWRVPVGCYTHELLLMMMETMRRTQLSCLVERYGTPNVCVGVSETDSKQN